MPWEAFSSRVAELFIWLFTPFVNRARTTVLWPLVGIIFLPFTTLMYVVVSNPLVGVTGWGWFWMILGVVPDISSYASSASSKRHHIPAYSGTWE